MSDDAAVRRRLHPASMVSGLLRAIPQSAAAVAGSATLIGQRPFSELLLFAMGALAVALLFALIGWWRFRYHEADDAFVIESGLLQRRRRVIPLARVQDVAIERGPLARLIGAAVVRIETGGAGGDEGTLDMVSLAEAQRLRDLVRGRARSVDPEAEVGEPPERLLFALDTRGLLVSGVLNFSLLFFAAAFAVIQYLEDFGVVDPSDWVTEQRAEAARSEATLTAFLVIGAIVLVGGVLTGIVRTVARDFRFRLTAGDKGLRRRRGLLTLSEIVIPRHRIQVAVLRQRLVERMLGYGSLHLQTLGGDTRSSAGREVAVPFGTPADIAPVLAELRLMAAPADADFRRAPRRALIRRLLLPAALAVLTAGVALAVEPRAGLLSGAFLLIAALQAVGWLRSGYAPGGDALYVRKAMIASRTFTIPYSRLQTFELRRGPLQRRLRLASLLPDTAGGSAMDPPTIVDLDAAEAERLCAQLIGQERTARAELRRARRAALMACG